jgi:hypothetical protein
MGQLTREEIDRCSGDPEATLTLSIPEFASVSPKKGGKKYTPLLKRRDRPDAIAWLVKFYPEMPDAVVCSLLSTTKNTVLSIRGRTHAKINEVKPRDPVLLGFCSQMELDTAIAQIKPKQEET